MCCNNFYKCIDLFIHFISFPSLCNYSKFILILFLFLILISHFYFNIFKLNLEINPPLTRLAWNYWWLLDGSIVILWREIFPIYSWTGHPGVHSLRHLCLECKHHPGHQSLQTKNNFKQISKLVFSSPIKSTNLI